MGRIEKMWESYRQRVVTRGASAIQVHETQMAFWAGSAAMFGTIVRMLDPGEEATDADLAKMDEIKAEIDAFVEGERAARGAVGN